MLPTILVVGGNGFLGKTATPLLFQSVVLGFLMWFDRVSYLQSCGEEGLEGEEYQVGEVPRASAPSASVHGVSF